jgi:dihydropteroate synthase
MFYSSPKTKIMAILNVTPDSFSDGGRLITLDAALRAAEHALLAGASVLDVGGESTRPGASVVDVEAEIERVVPHIEAIHQRFPEAVLSVDTRKAPVAEAAIQAGASWINDVSGLQFDPAMAETVVRHNATLVLMHSQGTPDTMQRDPQYPQGVVSAVLNFFKQQIALAEKAGISRERLILDPGFGFGKTLAHNLDLLRGLDGFQALGLPVLVGTSRKSFLTMGNRDILVDEREALTAVSVAMAVQHGVAYVRVHDVEVHAPVIRLAEALYQREAMPESSPSSPGKPLVMN